MLLELNALAKDVRESNTFGEFKLKLLATIRPDKKPLFEICDTRGVQASPFKARDHARAPWHAPVVAETRNKTRAWFKRTL